MNSEYYAKRFEVVFLVCHHRGPKMTISAAAKVAKKSKQFVQKWVSQWRYENNVNDKPNVKPNRATNSRQNKKIVKLFDKNEGMSLSQGKEQLKKVNINISKSTLQRRLIENNMKYRSTMRKPLLKPIHMEKRIRFATENLGTNWDQVIFTDESSFFLSNNLTHTWCSAQKISIVRTVKHPQKVHAYGAFCSKGFGTLTIFSDILDAQKMKTLYRSTLLPTAKKFYGNANNKWLLYEDNDPKHKSRLCNQWKQENGIPVMNCPPQSPDCNPIENVWALIKQKLKGKKFTNIKQLSRFLKRQWNSLPVEYAKKLSDSMTSRCSAVLGNHGEWINY